MIPAQVWKRLNLPTHPCQRAEQRPRAVSRAGTHHRRSQSLPRVSSSLNKFCTNKQQVPQASGEHVSPGGRGEWSLLGSVPQGSPRSDPSHLQSCSAIFSTQKAPLCSKGPEFLALWASSPTPSWYSIAVSCPIRDWQRLVKPIQVLSQVLGSKRRSPSAPPHQWSNALWYLGLAKWQGTMSFLSILSQALNFFPS